MIRFIGWSLLPVTVFGWEFFLLFYTYENVLVLSSEVSSPLIFRK